MIKIYLTNLGKYNEGELVGEWIEMPISEEELQEVFKRIGINEEYEEFFITDYECDIEGVKIGEYESIEKLNEIAEAFEDINEHESIIIQAMLSEGYSLEDAIEKKDDCMMYPNCEDMEDVAREYAEQVGLLDGIPENLQNYFDFEAFGRDMSFEGQYVFIGNDCVQII